MGLVELILLGCAGEPEETGAPADSDPPEDSSDSGELGPDVDGDGWTVERGDCDDWRAEVHPGAEELAGSEVDEDCDGFVDELPLQRGGLLLSEVMVTPFAVEDHRGEWLELRNLSSEGVLELDGLVIRCGPLSLEVDGHVEPGGHFLLAASGEDNGGLSVDLDYAYGSFNLSERLLVARLGDEELDRVWLELLQVDAGVSVMRRAPELSAEWCASASSYGEGDLGTPGEDNGPCRSEVDADGDGYAADVDCDDGAASVHPGAEELWYDGVDQDCDGNDADADGDGWEGAEDCDDGDPSVDPGEGEVWYDGVDQDCDGNDDDADGDGWPAPLDCDEGDASVHPEALETWDDGLDQDCDGLDAEPADSGGADSGGADSGGADSGGADTGGADTGGTGGSDTGGIGGDTGG